MATGIYERKRKPLIERFERFFDKSNGCWEWTGRISPFGYGQFSISAGESWQAHRLSYKIYKGEHPKKLCVCHTCDNRKCVNPSHLWLGTRNDNIQDMIKKGRATKASPENNGGAKLNWNKVRKIRKMYKTGKYFQRELATIFSVDTSQVKRITNNWSWKE